MPADDSAARWDLSLVLEGADLAAIEARLAAAAPVLDWLADRAVVVKAWSFATRARSSSR